MNAIRFFYFVLSLVFAPLFASVQNAVTEKLFSMRTNGWQPVQATVYQVTVYEDRPYWRAELSYSYSWQGEFYSGYRRQIFGREKAADVFSKTFPSGAPVTARIYPDQPEGAFLLFKDQFVRS